MSVKGVLRISLALAVGFAAPVWSAGTPVGTEITNSATVQFTFGGSSETAQSNVVSLVVNEIIDVDVDWNDPGNVAATSPDLAVPLSFNVINIGNGTEAFELTVAQEPGDDFNPGNLRIYLDDGDGLFDPNVDTLYVFNGNDLVLAPDTSRLVFVVSDIPSGRALGALGSLRLRATAVTAAAGGSPPGTVFAGAGDGGTDAIIGPRGASETDAGTYQIGEVSADLAKTQLVNGVPADANGFAAPGDTVTYVLTLTVSGEGDLHNARISDAIPERTSYVPGSITLDSGSGPQALTDAADADAGRFNSSVSPSRIEVQLGTVSSGSSRTVTFQVLVQ